VREKELGEMAGRRRERRRRRRGEIRTYMYMYMIHGCAVEEGSQAKRRSVEAKKKASLSV
jgi:hypothetical protein